MIAALGHVQVAAPRDCEADARRFYGALLGLEEIEKPAPLRARIPLRGHAGIEIRDELQLERALPSRLRLGPGRSRPYPRWADARGRHDPLRREPDPADTPR